MNYREAEPPSDAESPRCAFCDHPVHREHRCNDCPKGVGCHVPTGRWIVVPVALLAFAIRILLPAAIGMPLPDLSGVRASDLFAAAVPAAAGMGAYLAILIVLGEFARFVWKRILAGDRGVKALAEVARENDNRTAIRIGAECIAQPVDCAISPVRADGARIEGTASALR